MSTVCTSCGARLDDSAEQCDLCGTPVEGRAPSSAAEPVAAAAATVAASSSPMSESGVFCNQCGWKNPAEARFCSKCGTGLQTVDDHADEKLPPKSDDPVAPEVKPVTEDKEVGRRIGIIVGAGVLVVLALFVVTAMSKSDGTPSGPSAPAPASVAVDGPLADQFRGEEAGLRDGLDDLQGTERTDRLRQLMELYIRAGRYDLAGKEAERIALVTGTEEDWVLAGNLYYDWMDRQSGPTQSAYSKLATTAYRNALELNPDNLDVRTDMAVALLYDPEGAMLAIQETNAVLAVDSLHAQANFNRGIMLLQIGRVEQAESQFEKVLRITSDPQDPIRMRAQEALLTIRSGG